MNWSVPLMLLYLLPVPVKDGPLLTVLPFMQQVNESLLPLVLAVLSLSLATATLLYAAHGLGAFEPTEPRRRRTTYRSVAL